MESAHQSGVMSQLWSPPTNQVSCQLWSPPTNQASCQLWSPPTNQVSCHNYGVRPPIRCHVTTMESAHQSGVTSQLRRPANQSRVMTHIICDQILLGYKIAAEDPLDKVKKNTEMAIIFLYRNGYILNGFL